MKQKHYNGDHESDRKKLTAGYHRAMLLSAPYANRPVRLQSATAVCLLAPADRYSTETPGEAISSEFVMI